jgi:streptogramin lyase
MIVGPGHFLWFTEIDRTIGRTSPNPPYEITEFGPLAGGDGLQLTIGADGNIWFTEARTDYAIGRLRLQCPTTSSNYLCPTMFTRAATCGPEGGVWFTEPQKLLGLQGVPGELGRVQGALLGSVLRQAAWLARFRSFI